MNNASNIYRKWPTLPVPWSNLMQLTRRNWTRKESCGYAHWSQSARFSPSAAHKSPYTCWCFSAHTCSKTSLQVISAQQLNIYDLTSVADPKILILEQDPDPTCRVDTDPNHTSQVITDLVLNFQDVSDPDPIRIFFMKLSKDFRFKVEMFNIRLIFVKYCTFWV